MAPIEPAVNCSDISIVVIPYDLEALTVKMATKRGFVAILA